MSLKQMSNNTNVTKTNVTQTNVIRYKCHSNIKYFEFKSYDKKSLKQNDIVRKVNQNKSYLNKMPLDQKSL